MLNQNPSSGASIGIAEPCPKGHNGHKGRFMLVFWLGNDFRHNNQFIFPELQKCVHSNFEYHQLT